MKKLLLLMIGLDVLFIFSSHASQALFLNQFTIVAGNYQVSEDAALGQQIFTAGKDGLSLDSKAPFSGAQEVRAYVGLRTTTAPTASITFKFGNTKSPETELVFSLAAAKASEIITGKLSQGGKALHDTVAEQLKTEWNSNTSPSVNSFNYRLRSYTAIRPGWPEDFRARVEQDMAKLPDHNQKWLDVRIELTEGRVRFWVDDRLMSEKTDVSIHADSRAQIMVTSGVQLASPQISKLPEQTKGFVPVALAGYNNAKEFLNGASVLPESLPAVGKPVFIEKIPFIFPGVNSEGNDHLDIGKSLYREGNQAGYLPAKEQSWGGSLWLDPARIQLRVPNGFYDKLYVIAASDGEPSSIPEITALFYRPEAGFSETAEGTVPLAVAEGLTLKSIGVNLSDGRKVNLWLVEIPIDPAKLTSFSDLSIIEIELTKKVYEYRSYPDPIVTGFHQGGLPSSVHVYAATLGKSSIEFVWKADQFGAVWTSPANPAYTASVKNRTDGIQGGKLSVKTKSFDGTEETKQEKEVTVPADEEIKIPVSVPVTLNGYHDVEAILEIGGKTWTEKRSLVRLAPDTRAARWTEGKGVLFGYWSYQGAHYTPGSDQSIDLMTAAGARTGRLCPPPGNLAAQNHWAPHYSTASAWFSSSKQTPSAWAQKTPYDLKEYAAFQQAFIEKMEKTWMTYPEAYRPDVVPLLPEPHVSRRITDGNYPEYWGEPADKYTQEETDNTQYYYTVAKAAAEAIRTKWPDYQIVIPHGDPLFVVPLLRAGFPKNLVDGSGLDMPGFSRLPEQQLHHLTLHRLYILRKEYEKAGIPNPSLPFTEGIFVPTEVGNNTWREQMDLYNRWALISMAYGVKRFYSGWFAFDCGDYYGAEHYGGCGIQRRIPYCDPKPAYAAYATMTDQLDQANFDSWIKTGSLTTYCLLFKGPKKNIYTLWTLRGERAVTLNLSEDGEVKVTDAMNNTKVLRTEGRKVTFNTNPSVIYVNVPGTVESVTLGEAVHEDAKPAPDAVLIADLGDGSWKYTSEREMSYETNNFDTFRYPGKFSQAMETDARHGAVMVSKLEKQNKVHELMPWYNVLTPAKPIAIKGAPDSIGLWVKGASDWGRVVYCLRDAKGERWDSIGSKDQWNCNDMHSWSSFNFDGWRYLRFELPGHTGYDSFRKHGTTWWKSEGGDSVVDLPLTLEKIIVEQRSHILYVNDVQPVASDTVRFGKLYVEYATPQDATEEAMRLSNLRMPPPTGTAEKTNPIAEMTQNGTTEISVITKLEPPLSQNDGTKVHVFFKEVAGAVKYFVWCGPHEDGRGAVNVTPAGTASGELVKGLRPEMRFYLWVVTQDAAGKMSKPSAAATTLLTDQFKEK